MSREEFSELIYYISQLKHQYNRKIDEQTTKINDQNIVIEELLWQLRELSDKVRTLSGSVSALQKTNDITQQGGTEQRSCICRYENHVPKNRILNAVRSMEPIHGK